MSKEKSLKPIAAALGTTFAVSLLAGPVAGATENPFALTELPGGYKIAADDAEGACGEGTCGESQ